MKQNEGLRIWGVYIRETKGKKIYSASPTYPLHKFPSLGFAIKAVAVILHSWAGVSYENI